MDGASVVVDEKARQARLLRIFRDCTGARMRGETAYGVQRCPFCAELFEMRNYEQKFCCDDHKQAWWRRARVRGGQVYDLLVTWRKNRKTKGGKRGQISDIAHIVDQWLMDDREKAAKSAKEQKA